MRAGTSSPPREWPRSQNILGRIWVTSSGCRENGSRHFRHGRDSGEGLCESAPVLGQEAFKFTAYGDVVGALLTVRRLIEVRRFELDKFLVCRVQHEAHGINDCCLYCIVVSDKSGKTRIERKHKGVIP
jgi:hypothetical protein